MKYMLEGNRPTPHNRNSPRQTNYIIKSPQIRDSTMMKTHGHFVRSTDSFNNKNEQDNLYLPNSFVP